MSIISNVLGWRCHLSIGLADNKYFEDPAFMNYLKYLQYWKDPKYACYLVFALHTLVTPSYPQCLYFLDKLQDETFRFVCASYSTHLCSYFRIKTIFYF